MTHPAALNINESARTRIAELADVLMPGDDGLPMPSEIDVHGHWLDLAIAAAPAMGAAVARAAEIPGTPEAAIARMREEHPEVFMSFALLIAGAYVMHPRVRQSLGYEGQSIAENPALEGEAEYYLEDDLLKPVLTRGPIYREPPARK